MTGVRRTNTGEATAIAGDVDDNVLSRRSSSREPTNATTVLTVTDSVLFSTSDERGRADADPGGSSIAGAALRFRLAPDGSVGMNEIGDAASRDVAQVVALIPAILSKGGDQRRRELDS